MIVGEALVYAPLAVWLRGDALKPVLATLDAPALSDVARLHPASVATRTEVPSPDGPLDRWQQLRFFEALAQTFRSAAPIALVLDDLQWAHADTIEWLQDLRSTSNAHCLVVATVRAEEEQDNPPVERLLRQLAQHETLTVIQLGPLDEAATAQLADAVAEHPLDAAAAARTFRATEGHPLFIIERGRIAMGAGGVAPADNALSRVQSVVAARLALLSPPARAAAEVAAAIGRDFSVDLLARAIDFDEATLVGAVDELWRRQIVRGQPDGRWDFSHDRIREVAYSGLGPARAPLVHRRIAGAMEAMFAERLDEVSAAVAMHLDRGGQPARAIPFLERAAAVALRMSAAEESIRCLSDALRLLDSLPVTPERRARELELRSSLSVALNASRGYADPAVEANLDRVLSLTSDGTGATVPCAGDGSRSRFASCSGTCGQRAPLRTGARLQRTRSLVPLRSAPCDGRHADQRGRDRRRVPPLRNRAGVLRRAASTGIGARVRSRRVRPRLVRPRAVAARRRGGRPGPCIERPGAGGAPRSAL